MNKKGILPLLVLIPLILIGFIIFFFVLGGIVDLVTKIIIWSITLSIIFAGVYLLYKLYSNIFYEPIRKKCKGEKCRRK